MTRLPSARSRRDAIRLSAAVIAALLAVVAATATSARASSTTTSQPTTLTGSKGLSASGITATGAGVTATFDLVETVNWTQAGSLGVTYDPNLVRQGRSLDPSAGFSASGAGSMSISWTLQNLKVSWDGIGPLDLGNPTFTATGPCTLEDHRVRVSCHLAGSQITLLDSCAVFPLPCAGPYVKLGLVDDVTISPSAVATHRQATFGGNPDGENDLSLTDTPTTDPLAIPCTVGAGDSLTYSLGSVSTLTGDQRADQPAVRRRRCRQPRLPGPAGLRRLRIADRAARLELRHDRHGRRRCRLRPRRGPEEQRPADGRRRRPLFRQRRLCRHLRRFRIEQHLRVPDASLGLL